MAFQVIQDDCLRAMKSIPSHAVDACITDPPYGIDYQSARRIDKSTWKPKIANDDRPFVEWLPEAYRLTRVGGSLLCFCRWDVQETFRAAIVAAGFEVKSQVIWDRESHGMGDLGGAFAPQHDVIWFAVKGRFTFPADRPKSILRHARVSHEAMVHPNEKPVSLMRDLVRSVTYSGETVLDCFGGSFASGVACAIEGRNYIGIDVDAHYCAVGKARMLRASGIACDIPRPQRAFRPTPLFDSQAQPEMSLETLNEERLVSLSA